MYIMNRSLVVIFLFVACITSGVVKSFAKWEKSAMKESYSDVMPSIDIEYANETIVSAPEFRETALNALRPVHRNDIFCTPVVTRSQRWGVIFRVDVKSSDYKPSLTRVVVWTTDPNNTKSGLGVRYGQRGEGEPLPKDEQCR